MPPDLDLGGPAESDGRQRYWGKHRATCIDNRDPMHLGRVLVQVPAVTGAVPTGWAVPCAPVAGMLAGLFAVPPPGSGVWVEFEAGDVSRPIWVGGFWAAGEAPGPPPGASPPQPTQKVWRSDSGYALAMDDMAQTIVVTDPAGQNAVTIETLTGTVTVAGMARIVLDGALVHTGSGGAANPGVKGDLLMAYLAQLVTLFNTHVHPGQLAGGFLPVTPSPPVAPFQPPDPTLISTKVFLE